MPRRVYTYSESLGWGPLNMLSTIGAYVIAAGVLVFLIDLALHFRPTGGKNAGNIWNAGTLEWLPSYSHGTRSIPIVTSREPLWDQPGLAEHVDAGRYHLPNAPTGGRETIVSSPIDARPQYLLQMPGPSWLPLLAALGTAGFFLLLTVRLVVPAVACGALAAAMTLWWMWNTDPGPSQPPVDIGGGIMLPVYLNGGSSHSWWAMVILLMVSGSVFGSLLFSYLFLWTAAPGGWPAGDALPAPAWPMASAALLLTSGGCIAYAGRRLNSAAAQWPFRLAMPAAIALLAAALGAEFHGQWRTGLRPQDSGYGAVIYTLIGLQGFFVAVLLAMGSYTVARSLAGLLGAQRRVTFDNTLLLWYYTLAQGLIGLALVHLFPRLIG